MSGDDETTELTSSSQVPEELLLGCSRTGCIEETLRLLDLRLSGNLDFNINCKGEHKSNFGWTSLHLACYFGHAAIAEILINHGADVNLVNDKGDTPLHKAAYTSREDLVVMLLSCNANVFIRNGEGQTARDVSKDNDIKKLLKAAEETDIRKKCDILLHAAREGDITQIEQLLRDDHPPDINCTDSLGNTALHCAAYRGKKEVAVMLLQNGVDSSVRNNRGQLAIDLAISPSMKQILCVPPVKELQKNASRFEGLLLRKSHFLGWKEVWTVVDRGVMSFFASRADATTGTHRKGYKYLDGAEVVLDDNDVAVFIVRYSNNTRQRFSVPFVAQQQVDRQRWTNAITEHIEFSTHYLKQGMSEESDADDEIDIMPLGTMQDKLQTAQAHQQLLEKFIDDLKGEYSNLLPNKENKNYTVHHDSPFSTLPHQLALLIESSAKVSSSLSHCLTVFSQQEEVRLLKLRQEQEKCRVLQDALHALAQEHHELEKSFTSPFHSPPRSPLFPDTDCEEFFDAFEGDYSTSQIALLHNDSDTHSSKTAVESETGYFASFSSPSASLSESAMNLSQSAWGRAFLPVPMFSRNDFSIWSILKQCIGKDLTKITMPVVFNEPLSFLQRMAESMEYYYLLDKADLCEDPLRRMEYVAAFAVASISSNWERLGKPFNPLLGETYELVREDLGFRVVYEQVSHHPPVSAFHADSAHFIYSGAIHPKLKLWARSAEAKPEGTITLQLRKQNEVYTWSGVTCIIHNIIVGKLWMEQCGTMEITCHSNGLSTTLNFKPAGWFGKDLNCVEGFVSDRKKTRLRFIYGTWCTNLRSTDVDFYETYVNLKEQKQSSFGVSESDNTLVNDLRDSAVSSDAPLKSITRKKNGSLDNCPHLGFGAMNKTFDELPSLLLWQVNPRPAYSSEYYNFTLFAMALNELQDGMENTLPPTDSRLRPDIRKLEHSDLDMAASEKNRLEEKQRKARKIRNKEKSIWEPMWFTFKSHQYVKEDTWIFTGKYWEKKFSHSPDIF